MPIVIMKKGQEAKKVKATPVAQEERLQEYIRENPDLIPLDEIREDLRLFVFAREFPTRSGPIDALALDEEGAIYVIETKLYKNPDKRVVVAQVLDYGTGLWSTFRDNAEIETVIDQVVERKWGASFRQKVKEVFGLEDDQLASIMDRFRSDLQAGRFTFVVVMDRLHDQLKELIAFINANSTFTLLACELEFYRYEDWEIVIPKLYGAETGKAKSAPLGPTARKSWDEQAFFDDVRTKVGPAAEKRIREVYEYARRTADRIDWGAGKRGSFNPKYDRISRRSIFTVYSDGVLQVNFGWLNDDEAAVGVRRKLKEVLVRRMGLTVPADYEERYPSFKPSQWVDRAGELIAGLDELIEGQMGKGCVGGS